MGRLVQAVLDRELGRDVHTAAWDALDGQGRAAGSGVYLYRLEFGGRTVTRRMLLLR